MTFCSRRGHSELKSCAENVILRVESSFLMKRKLNSGKLKDIVNLSTEVNRHKVLCRTSGKQPDRKQRMGFALVFT